MYELNIKSISRSKEISEIEVQNTLGFLDKNVVSKNELAVAKARIRSSKSRSGNG
jgi:hypothetical protein